MVTPEWVDEMWKLSSSGQVDCDTLENLEKYRLPIFKGCVITISQLPQEIRTKVGCYIIINLERISLCEIRNCFRFIGS